MLKECSILIGGKAGDGIRQTGANLAALLNGLGYWIFVYEDYPSIIRGGHNFSIIRGADHKILAHEDEIDILLALDQETVSRHQHRLKEGSMIIFDSKAVKAEGIGLELTALVKAHSLPLIARNTAIFSILAAVIGADFTLVEKVIAANLKKKTAENIQLAKEAYDLAAPYHKKYELSLLDNPAKGLMTGNEALALGAVKGGLEFYAAYPMTPTSTILNYLAARHQEYGLKVIHAENEIGVIGMAEGAAYAGKRSMVGTSGGGFALMVEHLSLAGQAEIPIVIILGQRPGPATGLPTYSGQGELLFALYAGHGEFPRVLSAPGDTEEALVLARDAQNLAWQFQIPVIVLGDKHLCESIFTTDEAAVETLINPPKLWDGQGSYARYALTEDGISPLAFPGQPGAIVKLSSYEHDESGITTEDGEIAVLNVDKRRRKEAAIIAEMKKMETVKSYGDPKSETVLLVWGSTKGSAIEAAEKLGYRVVQPLYMHPLPMWDLAAHLQGAKKVIGIECNATGQFCGLVAAAGFKVDSRILKYDGRPFTAKELEKEIKAVL